MTRGKKRALTRIAQERREHVIKRLKERFGQYVDAKAFLSQVKKRKYRVIEELKGYRLLCVSKFSVNKEPVYFILRYGNKRREVATVLTEDMVRDKYSYLFEGGCEEL
jgi:hypothetical protein